MQYVREITTSHSSEWKKITNPDKTVFSKNVSNIHNVLVAKYE